MKGYKAVRPDMSSKRGDQIYKIGETYEMDGEIQLCERGFHFCRNLLDCYNYYDATPFTIILEVGIPDDAKIIGEPILNPPNYGLDPFYAAPKFCTNKMKIIRRVSQNEIRKAIEVNSPFSIRFACYLKFLIACDQDGDINFDEFELNESTSLKDLYTYYGAYNSYNAMINYKPGIYSELFTKYINEKLYHIMFGI